eukprot:4525051-Prymnesium_polylepis.1
MSPPPPHQASRLVRALVRTSIMLSVVTPFGGECTAALLGGFGAPSGENAQLACCARGCPLL